MCAQIVRNTYYYYSFNIYSSYDNMNMKIIRINQSTSDTDMY